VLDEMADLWRRGEDLGKFLSARGIDEQDLLELYGFTLSDLFHVTDCGRRIKLEGSDVLELGGKLARPLLKRVIKPSSWTSVGTYYDGEPHAAIGLEGPELTLKPEWNQYCNYSVLAYTSYAIKSMYAQKYDVVYSIAAFEHIHKLGLCLREVSKLIKPGGILYAYFTSCWMGKQGHHWTRVKKFIEDYDHLTNTEAEMKSLLIDRGRSEDESENDVYYMYRGARINRNTHSDYMKAFDIDEFTEKRVNAINLRKAADVLEPSKYERFKQLYPSEEYLCDGYQVFLLK
jgi:SAM-dependent methyltransferase